MSERLLVGDLSVLNKEDLLVSGGSDELVLVVLESQNIAVVGLTDLPSMQTTSSRQ